MARALVGEAHSNQVLVEKDVLVRMRDGVRLGADVYRPARPGQFPVLLGRTHYGKDTGGNWIDPVRTARDGYVVVINDMRGQYTSEGVFDPFVTDAEDGYDMVQWCASQPWADGKVGMFGSSSGGFAQLLAASKRPEALRAIAPMQTWTSFGRGNVYTPGGGFALFSQWWALMQAVSDPDQRLRKYAQDDEEYRVLRRGAASALREIDRWHRHLPLDEFPPLPRKVAEYFYRWVERPDMDAGWAALDVSKSYDSLAYPGLHLAGWFDRFSGDTIRNFVEMRRRTGPDQQVLVVGPWPHGVPVETSGPHRFFDPGLASVDVRALTLAFYDRWLRGQLQALTDVPPVRLFVLGIDRWRDADQWPPRDTRPTRYFLRSDGSANSHASAGRLHPESPGAEPPDVYVYDPDDPTPTDPALLARTGYTSGGMNAHGVQQRHDVVAYDTPPLHRPVEVLGDVTLTLWAATTALDTDWVATLADVSPHGRVTRLTDGMIRARYREAHDKPELVKPGDVVKYTIQFRPIANVFLSGHRIRLEIASASFPAIDRNMNTGNQPGTDARGQSATQLIFHDADRPSHIVLPLSGG